MAVSQIMSEPVISPNFTIEDIHKIRESDAEKYWSMPKGEFWAEVRANSLYMQEKIKKAREKRIAQETNGLTTNQAANI